MTLTSLWTMNVYNCLNYCFLCIFFRPGLTLHYSSFILSYHAVCPLFSLAFSHVWHPLYLHSSVHLFTLALALSEPLLMTSTPWVIRVSALGDGGVGKQLWPFRWVLCGCSCSLAEWQWSSSPSNFNCFVGKLRLPFQWYWPNARGTIPTVLPTLNRGLSPGSWLERQLCQNYWQAVWNSLVPRVTEVRVTAGSMPWVFGWW